MNAQLQPIVILPLQRPTYRRSDLLNHREDWIMANWKALQDWFDACSTTDCPSEPMVNFREFAFTQHEIECNQRDAYKDTYRGP